MITKINTLSINQTRVFYGVIALSCMAVVLGLLAHMEVVKGVGEGSTIMIGGGGVGAAFLLILGVCKYRDYSAYKALEKEPKLRRYFYNESPWWLIGSPIDAQGKSRKDGVNDKGISLAFTDKVNEEDDEGITDVEIDNEEKDKQYLKTMACINILQERGIRDRISDINEDTKGEVLLTLLNEGECIITLATGRFKLVKSEDDYIYVKLFTHEINKG